MIPEDNESFLGRWSRLKKQTRTDATAAEPKPSTPQTGAPAAATGSADAQGQAPAAAAQSAPAPQLPPLESLKGLASDYTEFLKPGVDENLKRAALKELFKDPYFENFERFEAYCEDYTQGEPIPAAMLKTLRHAKRLLFDEETEDETIPVTETPPPALPQAEGGAKPEASLEAGSEPLAHEPREKT